MLGKGDPSIYVCLGLPIAWVVLAGVLILGERIMHREAPHEGAGRNDWLADATSDDCGGDSGGVD